MTGAVKDYLAKPEFLKTPPRAVVWEIPERMIEEPVPESDMGWAQALDRQLPGK